MPKNKLQPLIDNYKREIEKTHLKDERYKWELLKKYKGLPNLNADNFLDEVKKINYDNLPYAMSKAVIKQLLLKEPEKIRLLFKNLFNESIDLNTRVKSFNKETLKIYRGLGETLSHHQDERSISVYLTYYNPEKYTFYKNAYYKELCDLLNIEQAKVNERYAHYLELIHQIISEYIENDTELIELVKSFIPEYYDGSNHLLVAQDILYQMFNKFEPINYWMYAPGKNASKWEEFYEKGIMGLGWDGLGDLNAYSTKKSIKIKLQELANTTSGKTNNTAANYDFLKVMKPGDIIIVKKGLNELIGYGEVTSELFFDDERESYKNYRNVDWILKGNWKLDFNLALKTLTNITKYKEKGNENINYYNKLLAIMNGDKVESKNVIEINNTPPTNQILYGPPGTGKTFATKEMAVTIIDADFVNSLDETLSNKEKRKCITDKYDELCKSEQIVFTTFHQSMSYEDFVEGIKPATKNENVIYDVEDGVFKNLCKKASEIKSSSNFDEAYSKFVNDVAEAGTIELKSLVQKKPFNVRINSNETAVAIPKTEIATEMGITKEMMRNYIVNGVIKDWRTYTTSIGEYIKEKYNVTVENTDSKAKNYVLIIDEINRGNVSAIFGELITLLEVDKRIGEDEEIIVKLPYSKVDFGVPANLHIIGTMNTADRSVEALDTALRRRFDFVEKMPDYDVIKNEMVGDLKLSEVLKTINKRIELLIDRDHTIGHSYFFNVNTSEKLANAFNNKIVPLLQEYFYGDYGKIGLVLGNGFVKRKKNKKIKFSSFEYEDKEQFITPKYKILTIDESSIIDVVEQLLETENN